MERLVPFGLNDERLKAIKDYGQAFFLGRVLSESQGIYKVMSNKKELYARVKGSLGYTASRREDYPAVGDWVVLDRDDDFHGKAVIHDILARKSMIKRKVAGNRSDEQIIAANIDIIFICMALNNDFNVRRLERYLVLCWDSGAKPVIVLTKADLCDDISEKLDAIADYAYEVDVLITSMVKMEGLQQLKTYTSETKTIAFIGSSGVGKSSLINYMLDEDKFKVNGLRNDDKGRHTTTHRELIALPNGGCVIDTPGMREIQLLDVEESVDHSFHDIESLASQCRFKNCQHESEPGCAVRQAIQDGILSEKRYQSYLKLKREAVYMESKVNKRVQREQKKQRKKIAKSIRKYKY